MTCYPCPKQDRAEALAADSRRQVDAAWARLRHVYLAAHDAGLGTVPLVANRLDRRGRGSELNPGYWADSVKYLEAEERKASMPSLFDLVTDEQVPA